MNSVIRYAPHFPSFRWLGVKRWWLNWFGQKKAVLSLDDLTPITHSSLLAMGYEKAEAEFIWETLQHDLVVSHTDQLVWIQQGR